MTIKKMIYYFNDIPNLNKSFEHFESNLLTKGPFVILVFADWCGHCKNMRTDWNASLKTATQDVVEVEASVYDHMTNTHPAHPFSQILSQNVRGYPTLGKIEHNKFSEYSQGSRTKTDFDKFLKKDKKSEKSGKSAKSIKALLNKYS